MTGGWAWNMPCPPGSFPDCSVNLPMRLFANAAAVIFVCAVNAGAQRPVTRNDAVASALDRGARAAMARADTLVGSAQLLTARQWENPSLALTYSKSEPRYHEILDLPVDLFGVRSARIGSARSARLASQYRFRFER